MSWVPLTGASIKETDAAIVETIGLTRDTYRASGYLRQRADPFRDPKQWQELLAEAGLGRDPVYPRVQETAKQRRREAQASIERLAGETRAARELAETKADVELDHAGAMLAEDDASTALVTAERELQVVTERYTAAKDGAARRATVEAELLAAQSAYRVLQEKATAAETAVVALAGTRSQLAELSTAPDTKKIEARVGEYETLVEKHREQTAAHDAGVRDLQRADRERADLGNRADALRAEADHLDARPLDDGATCTHCGQVLGYEAREQALAKYRADADALYAEAAKITVPVVPAAPLGDAPTAALAACRGQLRCAMESAAARAQLEERILQLMPQTKGLDEDELARAGAAVTAKQAELDDIEPVNLAVIEADGKTARATVTSRRIMLDDAKTTRARLDERLAAITRAEQTIAAAAIQEADLHALIDEYAVVEKACGRDGIPALIIENRVIPYLEEEAARILSLLGIGFRVEMHTQAERKDGSGLRDTFEVVVIDRDGNEAEFEDGTSGGEQTRIGFVLQVALAEYMALAGRGPRMLAVDEAPYLDASGSLALVRVLGEFIDRGVFDLILAVSHDADLRDSITDTILVVNEGGRSRIEGASVREAVEEVAAA